MRTTTSQQREQANKKPLPSILRIYCVRPKNNRHMNHYKTLAYSVSKAVRCYAQLDCIHPDHAAAFLSVALLVFMEVK